jgi:hypothetical protein
MLDVSNVWYVYKAKICSTRIFYYILSTREFIFEQTIFYLFSLPSSLKRSIDILLIDIWLAWNVSHMLKQIQLQ